jgi:hypothetical protein
MRQRLAVSLGLALAALYCGNASAQSTTTFEPGLWAIERTRSGGPGGAGTTKEQICVSAEQLKADPAALVRMPPPGAQTADAKTTAAPTCTLTNLRMDKNKISYLATCKSPMGALRLPWQGVFSASGFEISAKARMGLMSMSMRQVGRRVGQCNSKG